MNDQLANPFHPGEVHMQRRNGVHEDVMSYAPRVIRPIMPDQHRLFYTQQPFLVAAARDVNGNMWSSLLVADKDEDGTTAKFAATSPDPKTLQINGNFVPGDALESQLSLNSDVGLLGIELGTKRRNRVNGRITSTEGSAMTFVVDQSFGNCPQYITPRQWWWYGDGGKSKEQNALVSSELSTTQLEIIRNADTLFTATGYRGNGEDIRFGNDASHRGGQKGFLRVKDSRTLLLPDYAGNNHFNSIGNLIMDNRMGISIPLFESGGMLQLSGTAEVVFSNTTAGNVFPDAERIIVLTIQRVNELQPGSIPIRWSSSSSSGTTTRIVRVASIVQESKHVKSFYLEGTDDKQQQLWKFKAGQYLPIHLPTTTSGELRRTYSLSTSKCNNESSCKNNGITGYSPYYRISVKRHEFGKASQFLHDHVQVGDKFQVEEPMGEFVLNNKGQELDASTTSTSAPSASSSTSKKRTVLLSNGIGITPVLAMLHDLVAAQLQQQPANHGRQQEVLWFHGARNGLEHSFRTEVEALRQQASSVGLKLSTYTAYSQPDEQEDVGNYDIKGRVDVPLLHKYVGGLSSGTDDTNYYFCGTPAFVYGIEEGLLAAGVAQENIFFENF